MLSNYLALVLSTLPLALAQNCGQDNCYRAVRNYQEKTSAGFCGAYLASQTAAPSPFATCGPTRLSSACNCLVTATATATATQTTLKTTTTTTTAISSASASPTASGDVVINGSFESGASRTDLSPWTSEPVGAVSLASNSQSTSSFPFKARTGTKAAHMGHQGQEEPPTVLSQSISLAAGKIYTLTAYHSTLDLPFDTCTISAAVNGNIVAEALLFPGGGGGVGKAPPYQKLTGVYTAPETATGTLSIIFVCEDSTWGVVGIDDISLV